nr:unnamed protein product [Digitaria exilis]
MSRRGISSSAAAAAIILPPALSWLTAHLGYTAFIVLLRAGTLSPGDARHLFDELLQGPDPAPAYILNDLLAGLTRAPPSAACADGAALAIELFGRMPQAALVSRPTADTYATLIDGCCRIGAHRLRLALALFGHLIRMGAGLGVDGVVCRSLLKVLCCNGAMRPEEVPHVLRHGMPDLGCAPCVVSYTVVLKSFCGEGKSQQAHHLLQSMAAQGGACSPNLVSYSTVIHGLLTEGQHGKAFALLDEMRRQGIVPNVVTYNSIINFWCKAKSIEKAEAILQQMDVQ